MKKLLFSLFVISIFFGCKKYEDDPFSSRLLTVKSRMTLHSWEHASVYNYRTGHVYSTSYPNYHTGFSKDGVCSSEAYFLFDCDKWDLVEKKKILRITYRNGQQCDFKITTLTWKSFDLENDSIRISLKK